MKIQGSDPTRVPRPLAGEPSAETRTTAAASAPALQRPASAPPAPVADSVRVANRSGRATARLAFATESGDTAGPRFALGQATSRASSNPRAALNAARLRPYLIDSEDMVILRQNGKYQAFELSRTGRLMDQDFGSYAELRGASRLPGLPPNAEVFAVMADNKDFRFMQPQAGPAYARPPYPPPLLPANASVAQRQERLALLQRDFGAVADRLSQMASDLGKAGDHRGIFTNMYNITTQAGQAEVQRLIAGGQLREAEFLSSLCIDFANRYFDAYDAYTHGPLEAVSEPWRNAFDFGRQAQEAGVLPASVSKVLGLSIVAHIINDLPQTLQSTGYTTASDRESTLRATYDFFDAALMDRKSQIMGALKSNYGVNDTLILDRLADQIPFQANDTGQRKLFGVMRNTARERAESLSPQEITAEATRLGDWIRTLMPDLN